MRPPAKTAVWEFKFGPLKGKKFVGGVFVPSGQDDIFKINYVVLNHRRLTFFGIEETIYKSLINNVRNSENYNYDIPILDYVENFYSAISVLRDGSIISPMEFLDYLDIISY